jgi:hypothetical protein
MKKLGKMLATALIAASATFGGIAHAGIVTATVTADQIHDSISLEGLNNTIFYHWYAGGPVYDDHDSKEKVFFVEARYMGQITYKDELYTARTLPANALPWVKGSHAGGFVLDSESEGGGYWNLWHYAYHFALNTKPQSDYYFGNLDWDASWLEFADLGRMSLNEYDIYSATMHLWPLQNDGGPGAGSTISLRSFAELLAAQLVFVSGTPTTTHVVPEPATGALLLTGFGLLGIVARRRRNLERR